MNPDTVDSGIWLPGSEDLRAEQERLEKLRLLEKLRQLGINLDDLA